MKRWSRILVFGLSLSIFLFSGVKLYRTYREYTAGSELYDDVAESYIQTVEEAREDMREDSLKSNSDKEGDPGSDPTVKEPAARMDPDVVPIEVDFKGLKAQCPDVIGWLYCAGTPINYPLVQSDDNETYLYRLIDGTENKNGSIFMDFRNDSAFGDWNHLIYGHNMKNGSMFGSLTDYMDQGYYEKHPFWFLLTEEANYRIDLIGGYVTPDGSEAYTLPSDTVGRDRLYELASSSSVFSSNVEISEEERLITMSTCVYDYEDARFVLVGVLRKI